MLTKQEQEVINKLAEAWNAFIELPVEHDDDLTEFRQGIHRLQEKILARPARNFLNEKPPEIKGMEVRPADPPRVHLKILADNELAKIPGPYPDYFICPHEVIIFAKSEEKLEEKIKDIVNRWLSYGNVNVTRRKVIKFSQGFSDRISVTGFFFDVQHKKYFARMYYSAKTHVDVAIAIPKQ